MRRGGRVSPVGGWGDKPGFDHSEPWRAAWLTHAEGVSVRRLEEDVERAIATGVLDPHTDANSHPAFDPDADLGADLDPGADDPQTGAHPMGAETHPMAAEEKVTLFLTAPADVARLFRAVLASVQRRIERLNGRTASQSEALDAMLGHCLETWRLPLAEGVQREHRVFERDGWRCTVPGCTSYGNLHDHHVRFRSAGGSDELANRTTLCAFHHLRGVHAGLVRIRGRAPNELRFELGVRPGQPPLVAYGPGETVLRPSTG